MISLSLSDFTNFHSLWADIKTACSALVAFMTWMQTQWPHDGNPNDDVVPLKSFTGHQSGESLTCEAKILLDWS